MVSIRNLFLGWASMFASFLFLPVAFAAPSPAYLSFSVPDSSATYPLSINDDLTITGYYVDSSGKTHGFVRCFDGRITVLDVPGSLETKPVSINETGQITGYYLLPEIYLGYHFYVSQGFIRDRDGKITTFGTIAEFPPSGFSPQPVAITRQGEVVGNFPDVVNGSVAFIRSPGGTVQSFSINIGANYSTFLTAVNGHGDVVGYGGSDYPDSDVGFLWNGTGPVPPSSGSFIDYPGSDGTFPTGINNRGEIAGCYDIQSAPPPSPNTDTVVYYDFLRTPSGTFTKLDPPGTVPSCLAKASSLYFYDLLPSAVSLNNRGTVIGQVIDAANIPIGFVRFPDGKTIPFAIPESTLTVPAAINNLDVVTGYYTKGGKTEGFIALP